MSLNPEDLLSDARFCPMLVHQVDLSELSERDLSCVRRTFLERGGRTLAKRVAKIVASNGFSTPPPCSGIGSPTLKRARSASSNSLASMETSSSMYAADDDIWVAAEGLAALKAGKAARART